MKILNNQLCLLSSFNLSKPSLKSNSLISPEIVEPKRVYSSKLCSTSDLIRNVTDSTSTTQLAKPLTEPIKSRKFKLNCPRNGLVTKVANHQANPNMFLLIN